MPSASEFSSSPIANALDVDKRCRAVLAELEKSYPPGLKHVIAVDTTLVISESVNEVVTTIGEAIIIVIIVIFLFLQDWRATIIPAVTIPVSLIGTFAFIKIFGFSINSLTLFGITLATGLVVDDAIVVIENVQRHLSRTALIPERSELTEPDPYAPDVLDQAKTTGAGRGMETVSSDPHEATSIAMAEVTSAVIATSLVLISVFIPVSFFPGTTGILYKQFSLTIAFSIAISAFNALTLSPALAAILLRAETEKKGIMGFLLNPVERLIQWVIRVYARMVTFVVRIRYVMLLIFFGALAATAYMYNHVPTAFIPQEDQSYFLIIIQTPPGASLSYTTAFADQVGALVRKNDGVFGTFSVMGFSLSGGSSPNSGIIFAPLKPINDRTKMGPNFTAHAIVADVGPEALRRPRRHRLRSRASRRRRHRHRRRLPVHPAGLRPQHLRRHRPRCPHHRRPEPRSRLRTHRHEHHLHLERSADAYHRRSREGQDHGRSLQSDHCGAQHLHGLKLRQRL